MKLDPSDVKTVDIFVKEWLSMRGFTKTLIEFNSESTSDSTSSFNPLVIAETLITSACNASHSQFFSLWLSFEPLISSVPDASESANHLKSCLYKLYLSHCLKLKKFDLVLLFFQHNSKFSSFPAFSPFLQSAFSAPDDLSDPHVLHFLSSRTVDMLKLTTFNFFAMLFDSLKAPALLKLASQSSLYSPSLNSTFSPLPLSSLTVSSDSSVISGTHEGDVVCWNSDLMVRNSWKLNGKVGLIVPHPRTSVFAVSCQNFVTIIDYMQGKSKIFTINSKFSKFQPIILGLALAPKLPLVVVLLSTNKGIMLWAINLTQKSKTNDTSSGQNFHQIFNFGNSEILSSGCLQFNHNGSLLFCSFGSIIKAFDTSSLVKKPQEVLSFTSSFVVERLILSTNETSLIAVGQDATRLSLSVFNLTVSKSATPSSTRSLQKSGSTLLVFVDSQDRLLIVGNSLTFLNIDLSGLNSEPFLLGLDFLPSLIAFDCISHVFYLTGSVGGRNIIRKISTFEFEQRLS
ncbi:hypothetical protein RCL1_007225 [Eukaryota sp. TZLM3-RCL]